MATRFYFLLVIELFQRSDTKRGATLSRDFVDLNQDMMLPGGEIDIHVMFVKGFILAPAAVFIN